MWMKVSDADKATPPGTRTLSVTDDGIVVCCETLLLSVNGSVTAAATGERNGTQREVNRVRLATTSSIRQAVK